jgi:hypothetical protein
MKNMDRYTWMCLNATCQHWNEYQTKKKRMGEGLIPTPPHGKYVGEYI